jgi:hypothetical protein
LPGCCANIAVNALTKGLADRYAGKHDTDQCRCARARSSRSGITRSPATMQR